MTEILTFPTKQTTENKRRNAVETLEYIVDRAKAGDTNPQGVMVIWHDHSEDGTFKLRYIMGGDLNMVEAIGMMEMTKSDMLE